MPRALKSNYRNDTPFEVGDFVVHSRGNIGELAERDCGFVTQAGESWIRVKRFDGVSKIWTKDMTINMDRDVY